MPNWCSNNLTVEHDDPAMLDKFVKAYNAGNVCETFVGKHPEGSDWFDWNIANWGTKWDIGFDENTEKQGRHGTKAILTNNRVNCSFDSAWSPPLGLYEKLVEDGFLVHASYFEPGLGFCGTWINGWDNYIDYSDPDEIPLGLWNEYDMADFFQEDDLTSR